MRAWLTFERMRASHLFEIQVQQSQTVQMGLPVQFTEDEAEALADQRDAWTARVDGRIVCCISIAESFAGQQAVAMALFAQNIGAAHMAVTRFARDLVRKSPIPRIEAVALAHDAEAVLARFPYLDPWELLTAVMVDPTPPCRWARLCGLQPVAVLRKYGGMGQTHVLFERIS